MLSFVLGLVSTVTPAQTVKTKVDKHAVVIDNYIQHEMAKRQIPGLAYGICDKTSLVRIKSFGLADVQNQGPVWDHTLFDLASLTKQFTAVGILLLVQDKKLKLSDYLCQHIKDCPENWKNVTILQLLTHISGLPTVGYSGLKTLNSEQAYEFLGINFTKELGFVSIKTDTLEFTPGERALYSNPAYMLLGIVIDNVTGSYRDFMQKRIFDVAGMKDTYITNQTAVHPFEARGYTLQDGKLANIRRIWDFEIPSQTGIYSNVKDLSKWDSLLNTTDFLTAQSKNVLWKPGRLNNGMETIYGAGWFTKTFKGKSIVSHTGYTGTEIVKFVDDSVCVIVLTNLGGESKEVNAWGIAQGIAEKIGYSTRIDYDYITKDGLSLKKINAATAKKLTGHYVLSKSKSPRKFYSENDTLMYNNGTANFKLAELSDGNFIKLGVENEEILEVISKDYKNLQWKGNEEMLIRTNK